MRLLHCADEIDRDILRSRDRGKHGFKHLPLFSLEMARRFLINFEEDASTKHTTRDDKTILH